MATKREFLILWCCTWFSFAIMFIRLMMRKIRRMKFTLDDYLIMAAMACLMIRLGLINGTFVYGTNSIPDSLRKKHRFTPEEIRSREYGSKLSVSARPIFLLFLWILKFVVICMCQRLINGLKWSRPIINFYIFFHVATAIPIFIICFTECDPFYLYYQVVPDPGSCIKASLQLVVLSTFSLITDVMLIILPLTVLVRVKRPFWEKVRLLGLFSVGGFVVAVTIIRIMANYKKNLQVQRATWASVEVLAATFVANAPALYGLRRAHTQSSTPKATSSYATGGSGTNRSGTRIKIKGVGLNSRMPSFSSKPGGYVDLTEMNNMSSSNNDVQRPPPAAGHDNQIMVRTNVILESQPISDATEKV